MIQNRFGGERFYQAALPLIGWVDSGEILCRNHAILIKLQNLICDCFLLLDI